MTRRCDSDRLVLAWCSQVSGTERVHQLGLLVRRRAALSDGLRRGPGQLRGPERREPDVRERAGRHRGGAVHGHGGGRRGVPAVQGRPVAARRGRPAPRVAEDVGRGRPVVRLVRGPDALRQAVPGAERRHRRRRRRRLRRGRRRARQTVPVVVGRPLPGVQGQHVLTRRRRRRRPRPRPPGRDDRVNRDRGVTDPTGSQARPGRARRARRRRSSGRGHRKRTF